MKAHILILFAAALFTACNSKPKVISAESSGEEDQATHTHNTGTSSGMQDVHTVVCQEFMHTDKYTYMDVEENGERFWIAVPRQEVEKGASYQYSGGLMKTNFKSIEFERTFDKIYLVSGIVPAGHGSALQRAMTAQSGEQQAAPQSTPVSTAAPEDAVKLKELFANPAKYDGKTITISGQCVKINKMIMGRNWVHLDDGTIDGDLTVTTMEDIPVGATIALTGTIALNKDFGAGYKYEIIMEGASVVR